MSSQTLPAGLQAGRFLAGSSTTRAGITTALGGVLWLGAVLVLETVGLSEDEEFPFSFELLALMAGILLGWGFWTMVPAMTRRVGRIGARSMAICAALLCTGLALGDYLDFVAFLVAYTVGLFVTPLALVIFGIGLIGTGDLPAWGRLTPFAMAAMGAITYGFHALARDVWDPADAVWFLSLGFGWTLLGVSAISQARRH